VVGCISLFSAEAAHRTGRQLIHSIGTEGKLYEEIAKIDFFILKHGSA
jgi:hypothetical protein